MANEVNDGSDKVERINRGDRTSENTSRDSVIGGDRQDHQQIHQEASKAGQTFQGMNKQGKLDGATVGDPMSIQIIDAIDPNAIEVNISNSDKYLVVAGQQCEQSAPEQVAMVPQPLLDQQLHRVEQDDNNWQDGKDQNGNPTRFQQVMVERGQTLEDIARQQLDKNSSQQDILDYAKQLSKSYMGIPADAPFENSMLINVIPFQSNETDQQEDTNANRAALEAEAEQPKQDDEYDQSLLYGPSYHEGIESIEETSKNSEEAEQRTKKFEKFYGLRKEAEQKATDQGEQFFEAKAQGTMTAIHNLDQEPQYQPDQLIAANVTPNPSVVSDAANYPEADEVKVSEPSSNVPNDWLGAAQKIAQLPFDKQLQVIGAGLSAGFNEYNHQQRERSIGALIGTVQGVGTLATNLAKVADFSAYLVLNDHERAGQMGAEFGEALGNSIVGGVRLFEGAHHYLNDVGKAGYEGDYTKVFRDIDNLGKHLDKAWSELPPREQARIVSKLGTELAGDGLIGLGAAKAAGKLPGQFTKILDTISNDAQRVHRAGKNISEKSVRAIQEAVDDLLQPEFVTPDGQKIKLGRLERPRANKPDTGMLMSKADDAGIELEGGPKLEGKAGAGGDWPVINERPSTDVVKQEHPNACAPASGEMLSQGEIKQETLIKRLLEYWPESMRGKNMTSDISWLAKELGPDWQGGYLKIPGATRDNKLGWLLDRGETWGAELQEGGKIAHVVVVDGISETGNLLIKDPFHATEYEMTREEFLKYWTDRAVFRLKSEAK